MKTTWPLLSLLILIFACQKESREEASSGVYYGERFRPQIHFSPEEKWMNDPNGMVYYDGEYHLFYQYYPDSTVWGPMHWGHAVSTDLVNWEHLPIALYPDEIGLIFSGSAVIDWNNTSGFQNGEHPPMIAIYTQHDMEAEQKGGSTTHQTQSIAYSLDKGRTWTKYESNPVIPNPGIVDFRDPKVFWHEDSQKWVMIFAAGDRVKLYNSDDLKSWKLQSEFGSTYGAHGGVWECPDLFQLSTYTGESHWIMLVSINPGGPNGGSATQYFIGDFDGKTFIPQQAEDEIKWLDYGRDNYAGVTWSDIPKEDGRRLFIGWMSNWDYAQVVPTEKWRSAMTVPRSLHLVNQNSDLRVYSRPVSELKSIQAESFGFGEAVIDEDAIFRLNVNEPKLYKAPLRIELTIETQKSTSDHFGIVMENNAGDQYRFGFDQGRLYSDRTTAGLKEFEPRFAKGAHYAPILPPASNSELKLDVFVDKSSVEIFVNNGQQVMTELVFPIEDYDNIYLFSMEGQLAIKSFKTTALKSIWQK